MTQTSKYSWVYDASMNYGYVVRKSDGAESSLMTGDDCAKMRRDLNRLKSKTSSPRYPSSAPTFDAMFNNIVSEYIIDA